MNMDEQVSLAQNSEALSVCPEVPQLTYEADQFLTLFFRNLHVDFHSLFQFALLLAVNN